ncbi:MAG: hypothetical protein K8R02_05545 [Anaerohalosphaeraceae bacterium]|nr:hypothetical protein [Anaerohalosphaeraceae bacterium]
MQKFIALAVLCCLVLALTPADAKIVVHTNFEPNSAGAGTWTDSGGLNFWNDPDIAAGIKWTRPETYTYFDVSGTEAWQGNQCGYIQYQNCPAILDLGSGTNVGIYTATWYAKYKGDGDYSGKAELKILDNNDNAACLMYIHEYKDICYQYDNGLSGTLFADSNNDTWYEFELALNYGTRTYELKGRRAGTSTWTSSGNVGFANSSANSLNEIYLKRRYDASADTAYWDDIQIDMELCTYIEQGMLLGTNDTAEEFSDVNQLSSGVMSTWPQEHAIFAARLDHPQIVHLFSEYSLTADPCWMGEQGYQIYTCIDDPCLKDVMIVTAPNDIGVLYGIIRVNQELEINEQIEPFALNLNLRDKPMFEYRTAGPYANYTQYWKNFSCEYFTMEDFESYFNNTTEYNQWVDGSYAELANLKAQVTQAHRYGEKVYMHLGSPIYPHSERSRPEPPNPGFRTKIPQQHPEINATLTPEEIAAGVSQYFCWSSQILKDLVVKNFERIFAEVPELDGVVVVTHNGTGGYLNCHCATCSLKTPEERLADFIAAITTAMRKYNPNARVLLRNWGLAYHGLSIESVEPNLPQDCWYTTKLTVPPGNDYLWYDHFTPYVNTPRLVTFGEFGFHANDSTSAHMFYMGAKMRSRAINMANAGVKGRVGDCSEYGCRSLNQTAADEAAWDPNSFDPLDCVQRWGNRYFGTTVGSHITNALYGSEKITDFLVVNEIATNSSQFFHWDIDRFTQYTMAVEQVDEVKNASIQTFPELKERYEGIDALERSGRMASEMAAAKLLNSGTAVTEMELWARTTDALVKTASNYNMALLNYNLYRNTGFSEHKYLENARTYIDDAQEHKDEYLDLYTSFIGDSKQSQRYITIAGEEVEWGYDEVLAAQSSRSHYAVGNSSLSFSTWQGMNEASRTWHDNATLIIPKVLDPGDEFEIPLNADVTEGAILRIRFYTGTGGWTSYFHDDADVFINGDKIGEIYRRLQGYTVGSKEWTTGHHPPECYRSFVIPPLPSPTTIKIVPTDGQTLTIITMELRHMEETPPQTYLVNTTFEENSFGYGTWTLDEWGDGDSGSNNNDPDPLSTVKWRNNTSNTLVVTGGYDSSHCGRVAGTSTGSKFCTQEFGEGNNTNTYTATWYQKTKIISGTSENRYSYVEIRDNNDVNIAAIIRLDSGEGVIDIDNNGSYTTIMSATDDTWYEFELELNYQTHKFDVRARLAGSAGAWNSVTEQDFYSPDSDSFDRIYCRSKSDEAYGYFDDIKIAPTHPCNGLGYPTGDFNHNCSVNMDDFTMLASHWLNSECVISNLWCYGTDMELHDEVVDFKDMDTFTDNWLENNED